MGPRASTERKEDQREERGKMTLTVEYSEMTAKIVEPPRQARTEAYPHVHRKSINKRKNSRQCVCVCVCVCVCQRKTKDRADGMRETSAYSCVSVSVSVCMHGYVGLFSQFMYGRDTQVTNPMRCRDKANCNNTFPSILLLHPPSFSLTLSLSLSHLSNIRLHPFFLNIGQSWSTHEAKRTPRQFRYYVVQRGACWISVCVFSIRVCFVFCFCFCFLPLFHFSSLSFSSFSFIYFSFCCLSFRFLPLSPWHTHGISPDSSHTQSCTFLFFLLP